MSEASNSISFVHIQGVLFRFEKIKNYPPEILYVTSSYNIYQDIFLLKNDKGKWDFMDPEEDNSTFIEDIKYDLLKAAKSL